MKKPNVPEFAPLGDRIPGVPLREQKHYMGKWDNKPKRPPLRGEWYLSGAIVTAYRAPNDLKTPYYIAKIVKVKRETVTTISEVLP